MNFSIFCTNLLALGPTVIRTTSVLNLILIAVFSLPGFPSPADAPSPASAKSPASPTPATPESDALKQYGGILEATPNSTYPIRFTNPFTTVGEISLPSKQDLDKRAKLERLASLSDEKLKQELNNWPTFQKMSLGDQGRMLSRIQDFRDHRDHMAAQEAHELGLDNLPPSQQAAFANRYWELRLQMDQEVLKAIQPIVSDKQNGLKATLLQQFAKTPPHPGPLMASSPPPTPGGTIPATLKSSSAPVPSTLGTSTVNVSTPKP